MLNVEIFFLFFVFSPIDNNRHCSCTALSLGPPGTQGYRNESLYSSMLKRLSLDGATQLAVDLFAQHQRLCCPFLDFFSKCSPGTFSVVTFFQSKS